MLALLAIDEAVASYGPALNVPKKPFANVADKQKDARLRPWFQSFYSSGFSVPRGDFLIDDKPHPDLFGGCTTLGVKSRVLPRRQGSTNYTQREPPPYRAVKEMQKPYASDDSSAWQVPRGLEVSTAARVDREEGSDSVVQRASLMRVLVFSLYVSCTLTPVSRGWTVCSRVVDFCFCMQHVSWFFQRSCSIYSRVAVGFRICLLSRLTILLTPPLSYIYIYG